MVLHKQIYKRTPFGSGVLNTTLCGRVRFANEMNTAENDEAVTCKLCRRKMEVKHKNAARERGLPPVGEE